MPAERASLRRPARLRPLWFLLVVAAAGAAAVAASEASLELQLPDEKVTVGDAVPLRILARDAEQLLWGELTVKISRDGAWALSEGPREVPGSMPPVWDVTLIPLQVGELELPSFEVSVRRQGGEPETVAAEAGATVTVASVLTPDDEGEPAPLKAPLGVQGFPWEWVLPIASLVLPIVALVMWCWRRRRRRDEASGAPVLSPLEELQRTLVDLGPRIGREPAEVVCDRLASAVRRFLERRSGEPAAEMTSHELQVLARRSGWPEDVQTALLRVMRTADGARFGRIPAGETELSGARDLALQLGNRLESFFAPDETAEEEVA